MDVRYRNLRRRGLNTPIDDTRYLVLMQSIPLIRNFRRFLSKKELRIINSILLALVELGPTVSYRDKDSNQLYTVDTVELATLAQIDLSLLPKHRDIFTYIIYNIFSREEKIEAALTAINSFIWQYPFNEHQKISINKILEGLYLQRSNLQPYDDIRIEIAEGDYLSIDNLALAQSLKDLFLNMHRSIRHASLGTTPHAVTDIRAINAISPIPIDWRNIFGVILLSRDLAKKSY